MRVILKPAGLITLVIAMLILAIVPIVLMKRQALINKAMPPRPTMAQNTTPPPVTPTVPADPNNLLTETDWQFYQEDGSAGVQGTVADAPKAPAYHFDITTPGKKIWNIGFHNAIHNQAFKGGEKIRLRFFGRSTAKLGITVTLQLNRAPFPHCWKQDIRLTPNWQEYDYTFTADNYGKDEAILAFLFGNLPGDIEMAGIRLERK